jgi:hypothetical protein
MVPNFNLDIGDPMGLGTDGKISIGNPMGLSTDGKIYKIGVGIGTPSHPSNRVVSSSAAISHQITYGVLKICLMLIIC